VSVLWVGSDKEWGTVIQPFGTGVCLLNCLAVESHIALDSQSVLVHLSKNIMAEKQGVEA